MNFDVIILFRLNKPFPRFKFFMRSDGIIKLRFKSMLLLKLSFLLLNQLLRFRMWIEFMLKFIRNCRRHILIRLDWNRSHLLSRIFRLKFNCGFIRKVLQITCPQRFKGSIIWIWGLNCFKIDRRCGNNVFKFKFFCFSLKNSLSAFKSLFFQFFKF